ncbi:MAG: hypothetical protein ACJ74L_06095 [Gaiellaceae bacterium]
MAGGIAATWPAVLHARSHFMSGGAEANGEAAPGDHLQSLYHYWLVGHQLEHGRAPWRDPYTFQPEATPQPNYAGWPFGVLFWPLGSLFGLVGGWNALQLVVYVLAGLFACAWLRELGLPRGPALAGGLAFAIAPYRVQQSVGHLLGPISILLPLCLWAFERGWLWLSAAALVSVPLSGQVHLALGAIPFVVAYALCRTRNRRTLAAVLGGAVAAVAAGLLVRETLIAGSTESGGRKLAEITRYSANVGDFVSRNLGQGRSEQFVFLGWLTPLIALAGLVLLVRARRYALAGVLAAGVVIPVVLALGTNTPIYSALWHALPPFRFPRVPERLLPIACLCLAALFAFAVARTRLALVAIALLFVDLHAQVYRESAAGSPAPVAYHGPGRVLELPIFDPSVHLGSVYLWYDTASQRQRPAGYATTAPRAAKRIADRLQRLNCGDWSGDTSGLLDRLGVRAIALHLGLYDLTHAEGNTAWFALQALVDHGWSVQRSAGPVLLLERKTQRSIQTLPAPSPTTPVYCQGWYGEQNGGRYMSETHAPFWLHGDVKKLTFAPSRFVPRVRVRPGPAGWNLVTVDVPSLVRVRGEKKLVGARLVTCPSRGTRNQRTASCP